MERRVLLASSAISSSERIQRRISSCSGVSGSICEKSSVRQSCFRSSCSGISPPARPESCREKALARRAASNREQMRSSSVVLRVPPIFRRARESARLRTPEKESVPFLKIRPRASEVSCWSRSITARSVTGRRERQRDFASSLKAYSVSCPRIL